MVGKVKLHIKNQLGMNIYFCCGIDIERELAPEEEVTIEVSDGDYMYFDYVTEPKQKEVS